LKNEAVLDCLGRFGWSSGEHELRLSRRELVGAFDWAQCRQGDGKFDPKKFLAINHDHLKSPHLTSDEDYASRVLPFIHARGLVEVSIDDVAHTIFAVRERGQTFAQAAELLDPFFRHPPIMDEKAARKFLASDATTTLRALHALLLEPGEWSASALETRFTRWLEEHQLAMKDIGQSMRVALTGRPASPSLYDVLVILGRDRSIERIAHAAGLAESTLKKLRSQQPLFSASRSRQTSWSPSECVEETR
jgi:glutamyl-tRNA synthetase